LVLLDNGGDALTIRNLSSASGSFPFTFKTALPSGATIDVTVGTQPLSEICTINGTGKVSGTTNITDIDVDCQ
jgi:hypothetical protein